MGVVVTNVERADADVIAGLADAVAATVYEAQERTRCLAPHLRPVWTGAAIAGSAVTTSAPPGDNWMLHVAIEQLRDGDIFVLSSTSHCDDGYFGDLSATSAMARGCKDLIIETGARNLRDFTAMGFPVWAESVSVQGTIKETPGSANVPIVCGGQSINAGDVIVADDDGVVVAKGSEAAAVLAAAQARIAMAEAKRTRLASGELGLDMYDMCAQLAAKGLKYV